MLVMLAGDFPALQTPEFWVAVSFLFFLILLTYYGVPKLITDALDKRAETIKHELDEARRLREEAHQLLADYQKKSREAESEAKSIVEQARREAEAMAAETRKTLAETVERRSKLAEDKIARAEAQALSEVRTAAVDLAISTAEKVIRAKTAGATGASLVEESIRDLKGKLN